MESINLVANSAPGATAKKLNHTYPFFHPQAPQNLKEYTKFKDNQFLLCCYTD